MANGGAESTVKTAVRLVLGVARLGEADLRGWWNCHGLDKEGSFVLKRAFPRTWQPAALEVDVLSARRRHAQALSGRRTALHLFSDELPFNRWAAAWLAEQKTAPEVDPLFGELASWDLAVAGTRLSEWAGVDVVGEPIGDGLLLGRLSRPDLEDEFARTSVAARLSAAYAGMEDPFKAPYFDVAA
ncbi:MAG: BrxE family protein [bacterium]|nr:BrxE family protein [bacterium]MCY3889187.1 BrxE family protein [bacterium]